MTITALACWTLGPAYDRVGDEPLRCLACPKEVTADQYCEECGEPLCGGACGVILRQQRYCLPCAASLRESSRQERMGGRS